MTQPHYLIVCDHDDALKVVALLPWLEDRQGWWAAEGVHEDAVLTWPMEGNQRGWDTKWLRPEWTSDDEVDLRRDAIEIRCTSEQCSTAAYRSDDAKLQTLLRLIVSDEQFRSAVVVSADERLIVMKLKALHLARSYAKRHHRLLV